MTIDKMSLDKMFVNCQQNDCRRDVCRQNDSRRDVCRQNVCKQNDCRRDVRRQNDWRRNDMLPLESLGDNHLRYLRDTDGERARE
jgi:hypothetical protein